MKIDLLARLNAARAERRMAAVITELGGGAQRLAVEGEAGADEPLVRDALDRGGSCMAQTEAGQVFVAVHAPPVRIVIVGAVHIAQTLAPLAGALDHAVLVVDPRTAFATGDRFPEAELVADWPDVALPKLKLDRRTALAALSHDPKIDDPALIEALARGCFYVGALGGRKSNAKRRERLAAAGVPEADLDRIRAPIGLDIGAATPAEIAVAVMAEITQALRRPETL